MAGLAANRMIARGQFCNICGADLRAATMFRLALDQAAEQARYYCTHCADELVRCSVCRRRLGTRPQERIFMLPGDEPHIYCESCWGRPHCQACGRPVGATSYSRADGRLLCDLCHATAVYSEEDANRLFAQIVERLRAVLGISLTVGAHFYLVSREQMAALRGAAPENSALQSADYVGLYVHQGRMRALYVEYGLPRILFCEVVAHEYAHAWQAENCPLLSDPLLREGFAEWTAYKLLESWGARRRLERFRQRSDFYGQGLRLLLDRERNGGVRGVIDSVIRST